MSAALKGKQRSNETKEKIRGENNPMFGIKHSEEARNKMSAVKKGKPRPLEAGRE